MGKSTINGTVSIAMFDYWVVSHRFLIFYELGFPSCNDWFLELLNVPLVGCKAESS